MQRAIRSYGSKLAVLRSTISDQVEMVVGLLGGPAPGTPLATEFTPSAPEAAPQPPTAPPLSLTPLQKLAAALDLLGELTNAQVQKLMGCDADRTRAIIDGFVAEGLLVKVSPKLYKSANKQEAAA